MYTIYHNPRCRKSREGLQLLEDSGTPFRVVRYMDSPPSEAEIRSLLVKLAIPARDLVRKNETDWKDHYHGKELSEREIVGAMARHPKLIERPIVVSGDRAVIGRPLENIVELLK